MALTYADLDYLGLANVGVLDLETNAWWEASVGIPFGPGFSLPDRVGGDVGIELPGFALRFREEGPATRLEARVRRPGHRLDLDLRVDLPEGHETLGVVIPWSDDTFQYTSKHNTRPTVGEVRLDDRTYRFDPRTEAFGCLDHGRGIWPFRTVWNWGSASGRSDGHTVGLQLGGKWTVGTGLTENALCIDGRLTKIGDELEWEYDRGDFRAPWAIRSPDRDRVDLRFVPGYERKARVELGLVGVEAHICVGRYSGAVRTAEGERVEVVDLIGWAEEMRARW